MRFGYGRLRQGTVEYARELQNVPGYGRKGLGMAEKAKATAEYHKRTANRKPKVRLCLRYWKYILAGYVIGEDIL